VFFRIGSWGCVAAAAIHTLGQLTPRPTPQNPTEETLLKLLNTYQKNYGAGFHRSMSDFLNGFSISFAVLLVWVGVLCILTLRRHQADARFMRTVASVCAVFAGAVLAVSAVYFFLPPTVCLAVVFLGFAGAALLSTGEPRP
jgi:hypothetical protein